MPRQQIEPEALLSARRHLARAEELYRSPEGLFHLEEGLMLLDQLAAGEDRHLQRIAGNLAAAYAAKLYGAIQALLARDRALPEPELEHLFKLLLAFDQGDFQLPEQARETKITLARRLIDYYYEGHAPQVKQQALTQLTQIAQPQGRAARNRARRDRNKR